MSTINTLWIIGIISVATGVITQNGEFSLFGLICIFSVLTYSGLEYYYERRKPRHDEIYE
jgi:1,4-dihydroxy-2-naphthoate octaprenyltransferase